MKTVFAAAVSFLALAASAHAADVVDMPAAVFSWTGAYVGAFGGITAGDRDYTAGVAGIDIEGSVSNSGGLVGGVIGYDYQIDNFVVGAYADIAYSGDNADVKVSATGIGSIEASSNLDYLGTVQARGGVAVDRALFYAHGGFAYGQTSYDIDASAAGLGNVSLDLDDQNRTGYVVGAGLEYALTNNISFQTEYSFVDLGDDELEIDGNGIGIDEDVQFHAVKAGFNIRF